MYTSRSLAWRPALIRYHKDWCDQDTVTDWDIRQSMVPTALVPLHLVPWYPLRSCSLTLGGGELAQLVRVQGM